MEFNFDVGHLSVDRLLHDWRWLCKEPVSLIARNFFGDLFLQDDRGRVWMLDVGSGRLRQAAETVERFRSLAQTPEKEEEWFAADAQRRFSAAGLNPNREQCVAFKIPVVFAESASMPDNAYVGDLYESVSALGSIHRQIADVPDSRKVRLFVGKEPREE